MRYALTLLCLLSLHMPVFAYVGPGLGAGVIGVILGVLGSILLALFAIFWYPIKRLFKRGGKSLEKESTKIRKDEQSDKNKRNDTDKEQQPDN